LLVSLLFSLHFLWLGVELSSETLSSYECGFEPAGVSHCMFCMKFFLIAIIFIVFDVEVAFIIPGLSCFSLVFSFVLILLLGLVYEYAYGGLD
jgi:NADH-quinone oxidoreductase subunit A